MGRRWNGNQYMSRYIRRLERREFNKAWDNINHPDSPDGSRRCVNCAKNENCNLNRKGNHAACFSRISPERSAEENENESIAVFWFIIITIGALIPLACVNSALFCIAMFILIFIICLL